MSKIDARNDSAHVSKFPGNGKSDMEGKISHDDPTDPEYVGKGKTTVPVAGIPTKASLGALAQDNDHIHGSMKLLLCTSLCISKPDAFCMSHASTAHSGPQEDELHLRATAPPSRYLLRSGGTLRGCRAMVPHRVPRDGRRGVRAHAGPALRPQPDGLGGRPCVAGGGRSSHPLHRLPHRRHAFVSGKTVFLWFSRSPCRWWRAAQSPSAPPSSSQACSASGRIVLMWFCHLPQRHTRPVHVWLKPWAQLHLTNGSRLLLGGFPGSL